MTDSERLTPAPKQPVAPRRAVFRARWIARASGAFGVATALTVLAGWWFDIPVLQYIIPGQPPMVVLSAIGVLLLGSALLVATSGDAAKIVGLAGRCLAAAAAVVGLGGLLRYVPGLEIRVDDWAQRLLFGPLMPGSGMALATAASLSAIATGLLLQDVRFRRLRYAGLLATLFGLVVAAVGGLGYAYGLGAFHQGGPYSRMALVTATTLSVLGLGVLFSRQNRP